MVLPMTTAAMGDTNTIPVYRLRKRDPHAVMLSATVKEACRAAGEQLRGATADDVRAWFRASQIGARMSAPMAARAEAYAVLCAEVAS